MSTAPYILIAEDSPTQAQRLRHILEQKGYEVLVAANGRLGLEAARRRKPTLLVSDVVMPEMDGYQLCGTLKSDSELSDIPVILVTTLSDPEDVIRGLECRADQFILKPYDEVHLLERVQFALINHGMRARDQPGMGIEIFFNGEKHFITADRLQILNLLLSTYEAAMQRNKELTSTQDTLRQTNSQLQVLTRELEDRVLQRTHQLEQTNEELRASQERFQTLAESLPQLVWTCGPDGRCDYVNRQWARYTGRAAESHLGEGWMNQLHPDERERVGAAWANAIRRGEPFDNEFHIEGADRSYRWFKSRSIPMRDAHGRIVKWFGSNTDFEDFKRSQRQLQTQLVRRDLLNRITHAIAERQDLHSIFQAAIVRVEDHLPVDFACMGLYDAASHAFEMLSAGLKHPAVTAALRTARTEQLEFVHPLFADCLQGQLLYEPQITPASPSLLAHLAAHGLRSAVLTPLMVEGRMFGLLVVGRHQPHAFNEDEREFLRELSEYVAIAAHQAELYGALERAYDDLRRTQQTVMQQERLRTLGQLASGVAHDINNAISPIALYTESLLEREPDLSTRARSYLETIQLAIRDVAQTVARMREFYRPRESGGEHASVDLNRLVQEVMQLTRARWHDEAQRRGVMVEVQPQLAEGLPQIMGVEGDIRDALTNLIFNAVDAMPDGGHIIVRTAPDQRSSHSSTVSYVHLEVIDDGIGMDAATRDRCLEPFFTTKGERGTGLGLAMVYGMARRHSAELEIDSQSGKGTALRLLFPVRAADPAMAPQSDTPRTASRPLRILVVDDDDLLLQSMLLTLRHDGHDVDGARGGQLGIDMFRDAQANEPFDVVLTDLGMPYVDGRKVAESVRAMAPAVHIIMLTGWGKDVDEEHRPPQVDLLLGKPPRLNELRVALASCAGQPTRKIG